jgi:type II secretion system protein I
LKNNKGFTLVEALVAMAIVIFVVVSILSGFTQQMVTNRFAQAKNVAITLAESKMEDYIKFRSSQMPAGSVDYVVEQNRKMVVYQVDPDQLIQYRRTAVVTVDPANAAITNIRVTVEYGKHGTGYPFRVVLTSTRGG